MFPIKDCISSVHYFIRLQEDNLSRSECLHLVFTRDAGLDGGVRGSTEAPAGPVAGVQQPAAQAGRVEHPVLAASNSLNIGRSHVCLEWLTTNLEQKAVLLALPGVGDLPRGRAEAGVPAVVVALLLDEGVAAAVRDVAQQALLHTLPGGAAQHAARGPGRAAAVDSRLSTIYLSFFNDWRPVQFADALVEVEIFTMCERVANFLTKMSSLYL